MSEASTPAAGGEDRLPAGGRYEARSLDDLDAVGAETKTWTLGHDTGLRLDRHLQNHGGGMSRAQLQKLIAMGAVTVNGQPGKASQKLRAGDAIAMRVPPKPGSDLSPQEIPLSVLYEDDLMIVVNKDAGIIVHPARSYTSGTMLNALAHHFRRDAEGGGGEADALSGVGSAEARPGVVHRLDMNTTGCIVFAKDEASHHAIAKQFEHRTNLKCYLALVHGNPDPASGAVDAPIGKHPTIREAMAVRHDEKARSALTLYRVRRFYDGYALVECELKTGRTHQIRVHMQYIGHPIVGDIPYGGLPTGLPELQNPPEHVPGGRPGLTHATTKAEGQKMEAAFRERLAAAETAGDDSPLIGTPALHAGLLEIEHPRTGERMRFTAPLHDRMGAVVGWLEAHAHPRPGVTDGTHLPVPGK
ncbi:RluA family pseudouridine synthase [Phycisphaera mikurensis]|uniref:Ribosomal large subunit pseudouridine synthase D n=1 Tax=Phycisphaera mikurensis (strain NBRC 102666 / KCTC 22515 / FYK2301M01) TaxID=1142394 RepID=I0IHY5_PHYMF|nr:RluA family pseudouridine synthase [Phycisphaera mikurensis]MBB6441112.1 23S rRNA pseudouridine1911/1915/1917 synthase [Phycisphaera mikurensis]BAM04873.1 ribosomal large subunit pseudouridine synthase D [Phycisphaera mikurensis NBRC 102666]